MPDMLVKLYELPPYEPVAEQMRAQGVELRRGLPPEKHVVTEWVASTFGRGWASECECAFARLPVSCYVAVESDAAVGFGCYDATCLDFFGPTGVAESHRGRGIGTALLLRCLHAMRHAGYGYAVIGGSGSALDLSGCAQRFGADAENPQETL